jgi:integrase-like protein/Arm domain-containing DNA-binding protein
MTPSKPRDSDRASLDYPQFSFPMQMRDKLSALKVQTVKAPGRYADGGGLYLFIPRPGYKIWTYRFKLNGKQREMSLGPVSDVSLAEARELAGAARRLTRDGRDPIEVRRDTIAEHRVEQLKTVTFREAALDFLATSKVEAFKNDKHRKQWRSTLEQYAFPIVGNLPLQAIDTAIVLKALLPVWQRTPETGSRLRGRIERVFAWAKAHKLYDGENPATRDVLRDALPSKPKAKHHAAMPFADVPAFMARLRERDSMSARALEFCILTATRTSETIGARWSEIDLDAATWVHPREPHEGQARPSRGLV